MNWPHWLIRWRRSDRLAWRRMTDEQRLVCRVFNVPPRFLGV